MKRLLLALVVGQLAGCGEAGQTDVAFPLHVAGTDVTAPFTARSGATITLDRAELAFGPLYLCAGYQAGTACETARVEWLGSAVVDARREAAALAGELTGVTGALRSYMYDLGFTSLLTEKVPLAMPAATALGGASLRLDGTAAVDTVEVPFTATLVVQREPETELGVSVVQKSSTEDFGRDVTAAERGLLVRFDPRVWLEDVDFRALSGAEDCAPCRIEAGSQAYLAIHHAVTSGERPAFEWGFAP